MIGAWLVSSAAGSSGICSVAQIWPWGWGLLAPIMAPRFSKICTCWISGRAPSSMNSRPGFDDADDVGHVNACESQAVVGMKAQHTADTAFPLRQAQAVTTFRSPLRRIGQERRVVVGKGKHSGVLRVLLASGAHIAGT